MNPQKKSNDSISSKASVDCSFDTSDHEHTERESCRLLESPTLAGIGTVFSQASEQARRPTEPDAFGEATDVAKVDEDTPDAHVLLDFVAAHNAVGKLQSVTEWHRSARPSNVDGIARFLTEHRQDDPWTSIARIERGSYRRAQDCLGVDAVRVRRSAKRKRRAEELKENEKSYSTPSTAEEGRDGKRMKAKTL